MTSLPNFHDLILDEDRDIINIILQYKGIIYGGYIRDIIAKWIGNRDIHTIPMDIDVVFWTHMESSFIKRMRKLGYQLSRSDHGCNLFSKSGCRSIEFYSISDMKDGSALVPVIFPDFVINTVMFDGKIFKRWGDTKDTSIETVIDHIRNGNAGLLDADHLRKKKILNKGYNIN